jgi:hypothetical protein
MNHGMAVININNAVRRTGASSHEAVANTAKYGLSSNWSD